MFEEVSKSNIYKFVVGEEICDCKPRTIVFVRTDEPDREIISPIRFSGTIEKIFNLQTQHPSLLFLVDNKTGNRVYVSEYVASRSF